MAKRQKDRWRRIRTDVLESERSRFLWFGIALVVAGVVGSVATVAGVSLPGDLPVAYRGAVVVVGVLVIFGSLVGTAPDKRKTASERSDEAWRMKLIRRMERQWVDDLLPASFTALGRLELSCRYDPVLLAADTRAPLLSRIDRPSVVVPGSGLIDIVADGDTALLLVGEPGAGKTTLLMELAAEMLHRAVADSLAPIPVLLSMAAWPMASEPSLDEWMAGEMERLYYIPAEVTERWLFRGELLPLLDGLDEVAPSRRSGCATAIADMRRAYGGAPLIVTCREDEYRALPILLPFNVAVVVKSLDAATVRWHLDGCGGAAAGLRQAIDADPRVLELLRSPLWLKVAVLASARSSEGSPSSTSHGPAPASVLDWQQQLYEYYLEAMLSRTALRYPLERSRRYLAALAVALERRNTPVLYMEEIDVLWLPTRLEKRLVSIGMPLLCAVAVTIGVFVLAALGYASAAAVDESVDNVIGNSVLWGVFGGLIVRPVVGPVGRAAPRKTIRWSVRGFAPRSGGRRRWVWRTIVVSLFLFFLLLGPLPLLFIPFFGFVSEFPDPGEGDDPFGVLRRSARTAASCLAAAILVAVPAALIIEALPGEDIDTAFLAVGVLGIGLGFAIGVLLGLRNGGYACLCHLAIRWRLSRADRVPWRYVEFLEYASERSILRRVGPGYAFIHPSLRDHLVGHAARDLPASGSSHSPQAGLTGPQ